jgi:hypothetical protein
MMQNSTPIKSAINTKHEQDWYGTTNNFSLVLFLTYVFIFYTQLTSRWHLLTSIRFEFLLGSILVIIALLTKTYKCEPSKLINIVIVFYFICLFSFFFTPDLETTWFTFYTYVIKYSCFSLFVYKFVTGPRELKLFLIALFLAWLKMGQEGFLGTITGSMLWMNQGVMRLHGPTGLYLHPNSFAGFAVGTLPFVYYLFFAVKNNIVRIALIGQLIFSLNIILHSGSRTAYVAIFLLLFYLIYQTKYKIKYLVSLFAIIIVLAPYIPEQYTDRFETIFTGQEKVGQSSAKRKQILIDAVEIFLDNPFGVGVGAFPKTREQYFNRAQDTHNLYLQIATELGIQGLLLFTVLIFMLFMVLNRVVNDANEQLSSLKNKLTVESANFAIESHIKDLQLIQATAYALKMFIVARLALGLFGHDLYEIYWWFSIGIASSLYAIIQKSNNKTEHLLK